jgi:hypothetical protein
MKRALILLLLGTTVAAGDPAAVSFQPSPGRVRLLVGGAPVMTYVFTDAAIPRPYFADVRAPGGVPVTRSHPPIPGRDPTDHDTFHPGLWLAFGDLNGADFWRNQGRVRHEQFIAEPRGSSGRGAFAVRNRYLSPAGKTVCIETARYTLLVRPAGYLLLWDAEFRSDEGDLIFGDQEEMGLGIRVATPISVDRGGEIRDSAGRQNERGVRGQQPDWVDDRGKSNGQVAGVTLMPDPRNFRRSWFHVRDYGLIVANPFGRQALTGGDRSQVVVRKGEPFRLRFGVLLHAAAAGEPSQLEAAYQDYLRAREGERSADPATGDDPPPIPGSIGNPSLVRAR